MTKKIIALAAALTLTSAAAASASTVVYDFLKEANSGNAIGESIYSTFSTSSVYAGPNLDVTAAFNGASAFVYFDNGNAGMGVCKVPSTGAKINVATGGSANQCNPGSDDGITEVTESLTFTATESVFIESMSFNSNHDGGLKHALTSEWTINGVSYDADVDGTSIGGGNISFKLGFWMTAGESFDVFSTVAPDSYISAIAVSPVPLPASVLLMGLGLGGLGMMKRRRA